ncbi:NUDIX domain-containing protein [Kitasatospora sp. NPDC090091]|uniref:NUDIX domain-containing protein n=1 Tax=Kitasatospora sp. NPDC090091 TaxID=3364081 RepID=UPI00382F0EBC
MLPVPTKRELVAALVSTPDDPWWEDRVLHARLHPARGRCPSCLTRRRPGHQPVTAQARTRMCAVLLHDGCLALIRRDRPDGVQHSLPGGLIEPGEDPHAALRRELFEELGLNADDLPEPPVLRFVQEQETERPGESVSFRRRHLVYVAHLPDHLAAAVAAVEQDDPDRAPVVWLQVADAAALHLYPDAAAVLDQAVRPDTAAAGGPLLLPAVTGASYQWC